MTRLLIPGKFTEEELAQELEELLKAPADPPAPKLDAKLIGVIDAVPADNGSKKTPEEWIKNYWPSIRDGGVMASMEDYYAHFKQMKHDFEHGNAQQKALVKTLLTSYQDDFDWTGKNNCLISGTRVSYNATNLDAIIIQHYGCNQPNLITENRLTIPFYLDAVIANVTKEGAGLKYLQTLFATTDTAENIISTLEFISGKARDKIKVRTAATSGNYTRSIHPDRAAGFYYDNSGFRVLGFNLIYDYGRSRGVRR
jgi:hypothetical protein